MYAHHTFRAGPLFSTVHFPYNATRASLSSSRVGMYAWDLFTKLVGEVIQTIGVEHVLKWYWTINFSWNHVVHFWSKLASLKFILDHFKSSQGAGCTTSVSHLKGWMNTNIRLMCKMLCPILTIYPAYKCYWRILSNPLALSLVHTDISI